MVGYRKELPTITTTEQLIQAQRGRDVSRPDGKTKMDGDSTLTGSRAERQKVL